MMNLTWRPLETLYKTFHNTLTELDMYPNLLQTFVKRRHWKLWKKND